MVLAEESALAEKAVREALPGMSQTSIRIESEAYIMHFSRQQQNIASSARYNQPHGSCQQKNILENQHPSQSDVGSPVSGRGRIQPIKIQRQLFRDVVLNEEASGPVLTFLELETSESNNNAELGEEAHTDTKSEQSEIGNEPPHHLRNGEQIKHPLSCGVAFPYAAVINKP
ncbi:hypothetical protein JTB14_022205 [Gonioctena quinquepunctata]|nr:hypothetical protein JTB14_022205 [Gonioctena quinquepunctata]